MASGISFNQPPMAAKGMKPDEYAQKYADEKGISLSEAKSELKAQYGAPQGFGSSAVSDAISSGDVDGTGNHPSLPPEAMMLNQVYGIPIEVIQEGDDAIKQYAEENNINIPEKTQGSSLDIVS